MFLHWDGTGNFAVVVDFLVGTQPALLTVGGFTGGKKPDLVTASADIDNASAPLN